MLGKDHFYFDTIRNYIVAISHIFDDIHIQRTDTNGTVIKDITVPLSYCGKSKLFYKLQRDENIDKNVSTILPRISFIFNSMQHDSTRATSYSNTINFTSNDGINEEFQYNPIPYNFEFTVSIWSKYITDLHQMIEQIASFFFPDFNITVNEIPTLGITKDIPILLRNIDVQTDNDFEEEDRIVTADLELVLYGFIYKPISDSKLINHIKINMIDDTLEVAKTLETIDQTWNEISQNIDTVITTEA